MACGNNMVSRSGLQSAPAPLTGPGGAVAFTAPLTPQQVSATQQQTRRAMEQAEQRASAAATASAAARAVKDAQRALDEARRMRAPAGQRAALIRELEHRLEAVKRTADRVSPTDQAKEDRRRGEFGADRLSRMSLGVPPSLTSAPNVRSFSGTDANSIDYGQLPGSADGIDDRQLGPALEDAWAQSYHAATQGERDVVAFTVGNFTWVWDATAADGQADNRLIGVYGRSDPQGLPRDKGRIAGFPSPQHEHEVKVHRGHAAGHQLGGPDEGWNLFPQAADVNLGGRWKALEKYCKDNPGTFMFVRAVYSNDTDAPTALEYGIEDRSGQIAVEEFDNL